MDALALGLSLGIGAGVAPGPLLAVVIRASLEGGFAAGARVAMGPFLTDVPIIVFAAVLAAALPEEALAALGVAGGAFLVYLGVEALREDATPVEAAAGATGAAVDGSLRRGAITNLLNPHPWVFWITVGVPILGDGTTTEAAVFLVAFYFMLVGSKLVVAALLAAGRDRLLRGSGYRLALRASGVLLLAAGVALAIEGVHQL
jgi:threonine/homoserine/homoserine lactone efflux protein